MNPGPVLSEGFRSLLPATPLTGDFDKAVVEEEVLRHVRTKLDSRQYKKPLFASQLLEVIRRLHVPGWTGTPTTQKIAPENLEIRKVSGAFTNAVFFVYCKTHLSLTPTLLLRVYGPSSGLLISRARELLTLHMISTRYNIGPRVYGTFENGRIEEYFHSVALTPSEIRDPQISRWIAARMAELHSVDIRIVDDIVDRCDSLNPTSNGKVKGSIIRNLEVAASVEAWLGPAKMVLDLSQVSDKLRHQFDLGKFKEEWDKYIVWALARPGTFGTRRVFAHNDTQYGNLLRLKDGFGGVDEHRQIIVVDFEYAAPNPAAYDIANHFQEWTAHYHSEHPHVLDPAQYPTVDQRRNFYTSYLHHAAMLAEDPLDHGDRQRLTKLVEEMDKDVEAWSPASHAGGAIWGIVQARENIENGMDQPDFDYIGYAKGRMEAFRRSLKNLAIIV